MRSSANIPVRRGTVLICVLACLMVVSALIATTMQAALRSRREARLDRQLRQTELLCEAGVLRASQQLKKSSDYAGEQWRPMLGITSRENTSHESETATVDIRLISIENTASRRVEVIAKYDSAIDSTGPMQRTHTFIFKVSPTSNSENK